MSRYLTGLNRDKERQTQNSMQSRIANRFASSLSSEIQNSFEEIIAHYEKEGTISGASDKRSEQEKRLRRILEDEWREAAKSGGRRILDEAKSLHGKRWETKDALEEFEIGVEEFIRAEAARRITGITGVTMSMIQQRLSRLEEMDKSVDQIATDIREVVPSLSKYRSMMIARTESHSAYNAGHHAAAQASGLQLRREWISAVDERTRENGFDHVAADGEIVGKREEFRNTGEAMRYPGDPAGSAGNVIHCRCGVADIVD